MLWSHSGNYHRLNRSRLKNFPRQICPINSLHTNYSVHSICRIFPEGELKVSLSRLRFDTSSQVGYSTIRSKFQIRWVYIPHLRPKEPLEIPVVLHLQELLYLGTRATVDQKSHDTHDLRLREIPNLQMVIPNNRNSSQRHFQESQLRPEIALIPRLTKLMVALN